MPDKEDQKGYAVSPDAATTDASEGDLGTDISTAYVMIDGEKVSVLDLLKKVHKGGL